VRALCAALAAALVLPASASAHATLMSTTPGSDAVVRESPDRLVLTFSEAVIAGKDSVQVLDGVAQPVPTGRLTQPEEGKLVVPLGRELERGSYTVVWKVISRDQDPVEGAFAFHVSTSAAAAPLAAPASGESDLERITLIATYGLVAVCAAGAVALVFVAPRRRRTLLLALIVPAAALAAMPLIRDAAEPDDATGTQSAFRSRVMMGNLDGHLRVTPARTGANRIRLRLPRPTAASGGYSDVRLHASLEGGPTGVELAAVRGVDPRAFTVRRAYLPVRGNWVLRVSARRGPSRYAGTLALPVR
jgi:methionine-rich copper-binding protein CopC